MAIVDAGGHRGIEVANFAAERRNVLQYRGNPRIGKRQNISREDRKLLLATPQSYQAELLFLLYSQPDRMKTYLFLPPEVSDEFVSQLAAVREPKRGRSDSYENWTATGPDHFFDALKESLCLIEYAKRTLPAQHWRSGEPGWAARRRQIQLAPRSRPGGGWLRS